MSIYQKRKIAFRELLNINDWKVKSYTITKNNFFQAESVYKNTLKLLPEWLEMENSFNAKHDNAAFLIFHEATEGVFILVNWWVGQNMLNSHVFVVRHGRPGVPEKISGDGLVACVWEMEVMNHERMAWLNHMMKPMMPSFANYLKDTITTEL